ncbi:MAG: rhomboid family intramembrane serine protease [Beijerinckiaceae bacterium]
MLQHLWRLDFLIALLVFIWGLQIVNMATGYKLNPLLGLRPRKLAGLIGIPFMPLLHGSFAHASANSYPLIALGALMGLSDQARLPAASAIIILAGGAAVWLFARKAVHVGASGLVFGWFGYLLAQAWVDSNFQSFVIAIAVAGSYWTLIFGMLPRKGRVSWEAHLFGALAGAGAAWWLHG